MNRPTLFAVLLGAWLVVMMFLSLASIAYGWTVG